jgi:hypothetical protein
MSFILKRFFVYFTLISYLVVGGVAVRVFMPEMTTVSLSPSLSKIFSPISVKTAGTDALEAPEMLFADIKFPVVKKVIVAKKVTPKAIVVTNKAPELKAVYVAKNELPFNEPVKLSPVVMQEMKSVNLAALYNEFKYERVAIQETLSDEVSTSLAAADAEPEFFEYPSEKKESAKKEAPTAPQTVSNEVSKDEVINNVEIVEAVDKVTEEVEVDDLIAFDYSKVTEDIKSQSVPTVTGVTSQTGAVLSPSSNIAPMTMTSSKISSSVKTPIHDANDFVSAQKQLGSLVDNSPINVNALKAPVGYSSNLTIQITGTDLDKSHKEVGFEVRFQDDLSEAAQDNNTGDITLTEKLASRKMTRSVVVLKHGFAPTNTDLIVEDGDTSVSLPMISQDTLNSLLAPYEARGAIGSVLVELDDKAEGAVLDAPYSQVLNLDENMKVTKDDQFTYQLFVGVKAGNALLSYKANDGEVASKIIHIHERELTFDANYFESLSNERVELFEKDLLGREKTPLIISSEEVKEFMTGKVTKKVNSHTFKTDFVRTLLGGRRYLELGHQSEPVYVGLKDVATVEVPSENFMRYILSQFEGSKLNNRCLVQVNLSKKAVKIDVGAESVAQSLATYTQILDADGKFYDSLSEKSEKIIIVGENQGSSDVDQDGRINLKLTYEDGTTQYVGTYCSPNAYLVEQL